MAKAEIVRCPWSLRSPHETLYHDEEWGVPLHDDRRLFEFLVLESMQAGLSWSTILAKRDNFRRAFDSFDPTKVARYGAKQRARLMDDAGIVRNGMKIDAAINNAARFLDTQREFGSFDHYIWSFVDHRPVRNKFESQSQIPPKTELSDKISKDLKQRGFKFVGSTVIYAHMQATGMVNDHLVGCFRYKKV